MLRTLAVFALPTVTPCLCIAAPPPICWKAIKANARHRTLAPRSRRAGLPDL